jgi:hypothetical protein
MRPPIYPWRSTVTGTSCQRPRDSRFTRPNVTATRLIGSARRDRKCIVITLRLAQTAAGTRPTAESSPLVVPPREAYARQVDREG